MQIEATITVDSDDWLTVMVGRLTIRLPAHIYSGGADERAEITCGQSRVFVEAGDGSAEDLFVSQIERVS